MIFRLILAFHLAAGILKSRRRLLLENLALRHQLLVRTRDAPRPRWTTLDRALWACLSQSWNRWRAALWLVQPDTVIRWHRQGFSLFWKWKSRRQKAGRKTIAPETIDVIGKMSPINSLWGAPRIHGELLKLGIAVSQRTVAKYMVHRPPRSSSQNWTNFLRNHLGQMVSVDVLTIPTLTMRVLYVFVVLSHRRRRVLHFNVTEKPSAVWTAQQLGEAFPSA